MILPCDPVTAEPLLACDSGMGHCVDVHVPDVHQAPQQLALKRRLSQ